MADLITLPVSEIIVGERHRKEHGDIAGLAKSMRDVGLLQPVVVTKDKRLVAGARRIAAVRELGWPEVPVRVVDGLDDALLALRAEHDENVCRKEFTPSEAVAIGLALEELEKAKAKERQKEGGRAGGQGSGKLPEASTGDTRDKVAEAVGLSGRTYEKAKDVVEAAEADPELRPVVEEMDRTGKVDPAHRKVQEKRQASRGTRRRPRGFWKLDTLTRTTLGRSSVGFVQTHIDQLLNVCGATQQAAARLLVEGKAKNVKEVLANLASSPVADPARPDQGSPGQPQHQALTRAQERAKFEIHDLATKAINHLVRMPRNNQFRADGLEMVADWIRRNK